MDKLSGYILTYNSEKYLELILTKLSLVCDEILLIDSGSTDQTIEIGSKFDAKIISKPFENYTEQRNFAHSQCTHEYVIWFDSDEIPSDSLIEFIKSEKLQGFQQHIYSFKRNNYVLGQRVRVIYPVYDPEFRERLCPKLIQYESNLSVHETLDRKIERVRYDFDFDHFTFETVEEIQLKTHKYAKLYASQKSTKFSYKKLVLSPIAAWVKWFIIKGGFHDGYVGYILGKYAFQFTFYKYFYARDKN